MRGWMAHSTETSPALLRVTVEVTPGDWAPRLNSLPGVVDITLWAMLSSFTNEIVSPFLMVSVLAENVRPFCSTVCSAAANATAHPPANASASAMGISFMVTSLYGLKNRRWLPRHHRNRGRLHVAGQRLREGNEVGELVLREAERLHQLGPARTIEAALVVVLHDGIEGRHRAVVHVGGAQPDLAQAGRLERVLHLDDGRQELAAADIRVGEADVVEAVVGEVPPAMAVHA